MKASFATGQVAGNLACSDTPSISDYEGYEALGVGGQIVVELVANADDPEHVVSVSVIGTDLVFENGLR